MTNLFAVFKSDKHLKEIRVRVEEGREIPLVDLDRYLKEQLTGGRQILGFQIFPPTSGFLGIGSRPLKMRFETNYVEDAFVKCTGGQVMDIKKFGGLFRAKMTGGEAQRIKNLGVVVATSLVPVVRYQRIEELIDTYYKASNKRKATVKSSMRETIEDAIRQTYFRVPQDARTMSVVRMNFVFNTTHFVDNTPKRAYDVKYDSEGNPIVGAIGSEKTEVEKEGENKGIFEQVRKIMRRKKKLTYFKSAYVRYPLKKEEARLLRFYRDVKLPRVINELRKRGFHAGHDISYWEKIYGEENLKQKLEEAERLRAIRPRKLRNAKMEKGDHYPQTLAEEIKEKYNLDKKSIQHALNYALVKPRKNHLEEVLLLLYRLDVRYDSSEFANRTAIYEITADRRSEAKSFERIQDAIRTDGIEAIEI